MDKKKIILNTPNLELEQAKLKKQIQALVDKFKTQDGWSKREQDIQTSFTIELLKILGWDSSNWVLDTAQDVKTGKNPDIILKSDTGSKLLVIESKDASSKDKLDGSYGNKPFTQQLFNYCHGEGLYWGVLTNFIEWRLYSVQHGRLYKERKYAFHDLLWDNADKRYYIDLLSDEGLNFLSQLSKSELTRKNGIIDSDPIYYPEQLDLEQDKIKKDFFNKIKNWRAKLRAFIIKNYPKYDSELMSQKIIDRLIFIDLCSDRNIISQDYLDSVLQSKQLKYEELKSIFRAMDEKFNTELFEPNDADELKINDEIIIKIINELKKIDFSKLSVHIIGEVYENYLGEIAKGNIKREDTLKQKQKSKRKSQGIYYTPAYIVDYIVKNTVGELLKKCKTVEDVEKIKVLDPACGSGSFLIRAFEEIYNKYLEVSKEGGLLSFDFRKKVLQKNLFGVDLDPKAIEITKLNLMIKALEGVNPAELKGKHLLPNLNLNIRCGNSLIGGEKLKEKEQNLNLFDDYKTEIAKLTELKEKFYQAEANDEKKDLLVEIKKFETLINGKLNDGLKQYFKNLEKIKPFNYSVAFCEIFKDGGFDAVIGNPPWSSKMPIEITDYINNAYIIDTKNLNLFAPFVLESVNITNPNGLMGILIPKVFIKNTSYKIIRSKILDDWQLFKFIDFGKFPGVASDCICPIISKSKSKALTIIEKIFDGNLVSSHAINQNIFSKNPVQAFSFDITKEKQDLLNTINKVSVKLKEIADIKRGIELGQKTNLIKCDSCGVYNELSEKYYNLKASNYCKNCKRLIKNKKGICISSDIETDKYKIKCISGKELKKYYINDFYYIQESLKGVDYKREAFNKDRIFIKRIATRPGGTFVTQDKDVLAFNTVYSIFGIKDYNPKLILAILNSELMNFYYEYTYNLGMKLTTQITIEYLKELPIIKDPDEKISKNIIKLVDEMLKLNKTSESREKNKTKIEAVDYEIDQEVYKLYNLTPEEIKVVEGK